MIEKIKGIAIQGRCFSNRTTLMLYPNPNDRISVIYGKNGSGKSTISTGFHNLASESPVFDITLKLLDNTYCGGAGPRDFNIIDDYIICANENSNSVTVLKLEKDKPVLTNEQLEIGSPVCVIGGM